ncbi:MAG: GTP-binding protein [Candidatus Aenigmarchaeota archaeon]|nr:GTP-binding protein [Candidatus Aenigmarchaeota archaeon]MDW8149451.1 GTP-binding protein [Candidatus Aenigmarchaeota archaeon]
MKIPKKENKLIEFKSKLNREYHLKGDRKEHLVTQLNYLLENNGGYAVYIVGVDDNGKPIGINEYEFEETLQVLKEVASYCGAEVYKVEKFFDNGSLIGRIVFRKLSSGKEIQSINVGIAGHVHHGKSTLIATLITGKEDKNGKNWLYLNVLPHEIKRRLTADLHYTLLAYKNGKPLFFNNPLDKKEKRKIISESDKIVNFVDNVGHDAWIYSSIRGLIGQNLDYGILVVSAIDGITNITKEHLGIMLSINLPIVVCLTKTDLCKEEKINQVVEEISSLLKNIGRIPFLVKDTNDLGVILDKLEVVVPIIKTSAVTKEGYDILVDLFSKLRERKREVDGPFLLYIDKIYDIEGVGCVVSGNVLKGKIKEGETLLIGPLKDGSFEEVKASSIEIHNYRVNEASAGNIVGIAVKGVNTKDIKRGMILCDKSLNPKPIKKFLAEILVLTHPTKISDGYEPVVHIHTIEESAKIKLIDKDFVKSGEQCKALFTFKYNSHYISVGDKLIFREGKTKGIGTVLECYS